MNTRGNSSSRRKIVQGGNLRSTQKNKEHQQRQPSREAFSDYWNFLKKKK